MKKILGIDLGTTNTVSSIVEGGVVRILKQKDGSKTLPSMVAINKSTGESLIGKQAENKLFDDAWVVVRSVKSSMGKNKIIDKITGKEINVEKPSGTLYTPEEISALYLKEIKNSAEDVLGEKIDSAIITVPAYFNDKERKATVNAGRIAGLEIEKIINEPTAAALEYSFDKDASELQGDIFVYDFGGGTFDVSIINVSENNTYKVLATGGNNELGGDNIDQILSDYLKDELNKEYPNHIEWFGLEERTYQAAVKAKKDLSFQDKVEISLPAMGMATNGPINARLQITVEKFEELIGDIIDETVNTSLEVLKEAKIVAEDLKAVILVGGSTRIPLVREKISKALRREVNLTIDPDESVAAGASIEGAHINGDMDEISLLDVATHDLGIALDNDEFGILIKKNTTLPAMKTQTFTNSKVARVIEAPVIQGNWRLGASSADIIGNVKLDVGSDQSESSLDIVVEFHIDTEGMIKILLLDQVTGKKVEGNIDSKNLKSDNEISNLKDQIDRIYNMKAA